jgi:palmitoyltransferase
MAENQEQDILFQKTSILSTYFESENIEKIQSYIKNKLTKNDILNMRFTSSKKTLLIKLVLLECSQFTSLFDLIKEKLDPNDLILYVNIPDEDSNTPLLYAAFKGSYEKVECLIKNGAKIEMRNFMGLSVMHMAAEGDKPNMLIYFKDKYGFNVNDRDYPGNTPLHWACHMSAENSINFLLSWINDINILDRKGQTPLHLGIYYLRPKLIKKLLRKGADVNLKDFSGRSVMDILNDKKINVQNFKNVLRVIHNNEPFQLCVYPKKNEDKDKNDKDNCKELFNGFKDDDLKEKLIDGNDKDNDYNIKEEKSKSYLTYQRIFNSVMFVCLHIFFELLIFLFILPRINMHLYYVVFWVLIVSLFTSFYLTNKSDPGFLEAKDNLTWLEMVEKKININEYCPYCRVKKTSKIKHCHVCKKCVKGFDHHCNWIDNCVGENNKMRFLAFVFITLLNLIYNFCLSITDLNINEAQALNKNQHNNDVMNNIESMLNMRRIFNYRINDLISIMILIVSSFFFIPVIYVLGIQIRNLVMAKSNSN